MGACSSVRAVHTQRAGSMRLPSALDEHARGQPRVRLEHALHQPVEAEERIPFLLRSRAQVGLVRVRVRVRLRLRFGFGFGFGFGFRLRLRLRLGLGLGYPPERRAARPAPRAARAV